jgi:hypothetical protein
MLYFRGVMVKCPSPLRLDTLPQWGVSLYKKSPPKWGNVLVEGYLFRPLVLLCPSDVVGMVSTIVLVALVVEVDLLISAPKEGNPVLISRVERPATAVAYLKKSFHNFLQRTLVSY